MNKEIDWEQRRYEIARDLLLGGMQYNPPKGTTKAQCAVKIADDLIEELKKTSE